MAGVWERKPTATGFFRIASSGPRLAASLLFVWAFAAHAQNCPAPLAQLVLVKGSVELVRQGTQRLAVAEVNAGLCAGDTVVVHQRSQAALLLANATVVRLDQGTRVTISPPSPGQPALLSVISGAIYVISRTPQPFRVRTPFINANVEGTEFLVEVRRGPNSDAAGCPTAPAQPTETDRITVYEGRIQVEANPTPIFLDAGESAVATASQAATKVVTVRPREAVAWTLYVPTIIRSERVDPARFGCATQFLAQGFFGPAKQALLGMLPAGSGGGNDAVTYALLATIAVAENEREQATRYSDRAVELDAKSAPAWLARSYSQQAMFRVEDALGSADRAVTLEPSNALALARRAELQMSLGQLDAALASAQEAVRLDSQIAKTQTVLGFANLTRIDMKSARASFEGAIALDSTDPLPRLGLGLVRIRQGDLASGRGDIELAAVLDPTQSLIRSYLGKAYYDERQDRRAATQFRLAKELDPNDPTPWFYNALLAGADNMLVESVDELIESIRLNDRRGVYRSRLLLDEDLAVRSASLARSFLEIDLREAALALAATSLAVDPGSASAHRFLSDVNAGAPRHEITRASELLQAQLRQPLSVTPLQAQLSNDRLFSLQSNSPNSAGFNEFGSLFLRNGSSVRLYGVAGSDSTRGAQGLYSMVHDNLGLGLSLLHFTTDGVRPNGDSSENSSSAFFQLALSPQTSAQVEFTRQRSAFGDTVSRFYKDSATTERNSDRNEDIRFGLRHAFSNGSDFLIAINRNDDRGAADFGGGIAIGVRNTTTRAEAQYLLRTSNYSLVTGLGYLEGKTTEDIVGDVVESKPRHLNLYTYATYVLSPNVAYLHAGASYDHLRSRDAGNESQVNPKLGLTLRPGGESTVRAALFRVLKRRINADAGLEPTQVAGFDQYFDDVNGTKSWGTAVAADAKPFNATRVGLSFTQRSTDSPLTNPDGTIEFQRYHEREAAGYVHWTFDRVATLAVRARHTRYQRTPNSLGAEGFEFVETTELPVSVKVFGPAGLWSSLVVTYVQQRGRFSNAALDLVDDSERFHVADIAVGYRFARRRGDVSLECSNLLGKSFRFQDIGVEGARFSPQRACRLRLSVDL